MNECICCLCLLLFKQVEVYLFTSLICFAEDCEKYIVLFLDEQRSEFLSTLELIVNQMTVACGTAKPQYKKIDNFEVEKYLQTVCPKEDLQNFIQRFNKSADSFLTGSHATGNMRRSLEDEEDDDVDCGSRSPSPVHALFSAPIIKQVFCLISTSVKYFESK